MTRTLLAFLALLVLAPQAPAAPPKPKKPKAPAVTLDMTAGISFTYDDNVFRYSPDEIRLIKKLPKVDQYSTVETVDDLILGQSLSLVASRGNTRATLTIKQNTNYKNTMKTFHNYSVDLRQRIGTGAYGYLTYRFTPRYYIRQIYDVDTMDYEEYSYAKHYLSTEVRKSYQRGLSLRGHARYEREKYPDYFQEYDFHGFALEGEVAQRVSSRLGAGLVANYRRVSTKGYDEPNETKSTSDETDGSYHENTYELFGTYLLPFQVRGASPSLGLDVSWNRKVFTTDKSVSEDPYHAGRKDSKVAIEASYSMQLGRGVSGSLSYKWQKRRVDSHARDDLGEEKDFNANTVGLSVSLTRALIASGRSE